MPKKNPDKEGRPQRRKDLTEFLDSVNMNDMARVQELFKDLVSAVLKTFLIDSLVKMC